MPSLERPVSRNGPGGSTRVVTRKSFIHPFAAVMACWFRRALAIIELRNNTLLKPAKGRNQTRSSKTREEGIGGYNKAKMMITVYDDDGGVTYY